MQFRYFAKTLMLALVLAGCSAGVERNDSNGNSDATYVVGKVTGSNKHISSNALGLPNKSLLRLSACLSEVAVEQPIPGGEVFLISGDSFATETKSDPQGCVHWNEEFSFAYLQDETYFSIHRKIKGKKNQLGEHEVHIAVNPWNEDTSAILDLRPGFDQAPKLADTTASSSLTQNHLDIETIDLTLENIVSKTNVESNVVLHFKPRVFRRKLDGGIADVNISKGSFEVEFNLIDQQKELLKNPFITTQTFTQNSNRRKSQVEVRKSVFFERPLSSMSALVRIRPQVSIVGIKEVTCYIPIGVLRDNLLRASGCEEKPLVEIQKQREEINSAIQKGKQAPWELMQIKTIDSIVPQGFLSANSKKPRGIQVELEVCLKTGINREYPVSDKKIQIAPSSRQLFPDKKEHFPILTEVTNSNGCVRWHEVVPMRFYEEAHYKEGLVSFQIDEQTINRVIYINPWMRGTADKFVIDAAFSKKPDRIEFLDDSLVAAALGKQFKESTVSTNRESFKPRKGKIDISGFAFDFIGRKIRIDNSLDLSTERFYLFEFKPHITVQTQNGPENRPIDYGKYRLHVLLEAAHGNPQRDNDTPEGISANLHKENFHKIDACSHIDNVLESKAQLYVKNKDAWLKCVKQRFLDYTKVDVEANGSAISALVKLHFKDIRYVHSRSVISFEFEPIDKNSGLEPVTFKGTIEPVHPGGFRRVLQRSLPDFTSLALDQLPKINTEFLNSDERGEFNKAISKKQVNTLCKKTKAHNESETKCWADIQKIESIKGIVSLLEQEGVFQSDDQKTAEDNINRFRAEFDLQDFREFNPFSDKSFSEDEINYFIERIRNEAESDSLRPLNLEKLPFKAKNLLGRICSFFYLRPRSEELLGKSEEDKKHLQEMLQKYNDLEAKCRKSPTTHFYISTSLHTMEVDPYPLEEAYGDSNNIAVGATFSFDEGKAKDEFVGSGVKGGVDGNTQLHNVFGVGPNTMLGKAQFQWTGGIRGFGGKEWFWQSYDMKSKSEKQAVAGSFAKTINAEQITFELKMRNKPCLVIQPTTEVFKELKENSINVPSGFHICSNDLEEEIIKETYYYLYLFFRSHRSNIQDLPGSFAMRPWSLLIRGNDNFEMFRRQLQNKSKKFVFKEADKINFPNSTLREMFKRYGSGRAGVLRVDLLNDKRKEEEHLFTEEILKKHMENGNSFRCEDMAKIGIKPPKGFDCEKILEQMQRKQKHVPEDDWDLMRIAP